MPNNINDETTLIKLLRDRAKKEPNKILYTFLPDGETENGSLTYQALNQQAQAIAAQLQTFLSPGDRALLVYPYTDGLEFIAAFFGCLYAGVIAVTDSPPHHSRGFGKLLKRVSDSQASAILSTQGLLDRSPQLPPIPTIATDLIPITQAENWQEPQITADNLAFLQYTSGSTGNPKGVMITHKNILSNCALIYKSFDFSNQNRMFMWLPLFHDMGLIGGVMLPLYSDIIAYLTSPIAMIQKPLRWLQAIDRYRITISGGPNFAYDLLCAKITPEQRENLDLSSWEIAFSGAEPVRASTLERFNQLFAVANFRPESFYPCYGMAETTLFVSGGDKKALPIVKTIDKVALEQNQLIEQEEGQKIIGCGHAREGTEIVIVDPETHQACPPNKIGEIWVSSPSVGQGYWEKPAETAKIFQGQIIGQEEKHFLRTGDSGFLAQGELFITGRIKEMMILWGRNAYPQPLEETVQSAHPALRLNCGAAFSVEVDNEEQLVIAQELERSHLRKFNEEEIFGAIRKAIIEKHLFDVYAIVLLRTGSIPKTSSGKIQRRLCCSQFQAGELKIVSQWSNPLGSKSNMSDLLQLIEA